VTKIVIKHYLTNEMFFIIVRGKNKSKMETKSVFAISNGSETYFPKNTLTNFRNKFPNDIITNENYEISVESIGFSKNFKQIHIPEDGFPSLEKKKY